MVEGHGVHRIAARHRQAFLGKVLRAHSPNGRFTAGAALLHGSLVVAVEAVGKNLFYRVAPKKQTDDSDAVTVHIHFGMSGRFPVLESPPASFSETTRLVVEADGLCAPLSAMTCRTICSDEFHKMVSKSLGPDPIRAKLLQGKQHSPIDDVADHNAERFLRLVAKSRKTIAAALLDQKCVAGIGNIYRAEILFCAGIHPLQVCSEISEDKLRDIWQWSEYLLWKGYETGSITTVEKEESLRTERPLEGENRRYVYGREHCYRCSSPVTQWRIATRSLYACEKCQTSEDSQNTESAVGHSVASDEKKSQRKYTENVHNDVDWLLKTSERVNGEAKDNEWKHVDVETETTEAITVEKVTDHYKRRRLRSSSRRVQK